MPRHGSIAEQISALLAYKDRPDGDPAPVSTNWTVVPANNNADPEETADFSFERSLRVTPSVEEIMRNVKDGPTERNAGGQVVRIGRLRFSDGAQTESAYAMGPDGAVVVMDARMPVGAMLGTREKAETQLGGKGYTSAQLEQSNLYFARMLRTIEPRYLTRTERRNGKSISADESRAILAEAIANTPIMPRATKLGPGLPCGAPRVADSFHGMQKGRKGESGSIMWQDLATSIVNKEIWDETLRQLSEEDVTTLDVAMKAKTLREIGATHGFTGKRAERMGKKILRAANDNLSEAMKFSAA